PARHDAHSNGGGRRPAAGILAKRSSETSANDAGGLVAKVADLASRYDALREEAQRAAAAEGLVRVRLGSAVAEALTLAARAEQAARAAALAGYRATARRTIRPRRRNRLARLVDRTLDKAGFVGR